MANIKRFGAHSVSNLNYHIVFCPKRRKPVLHGDIIADFTSLVKEISEKQGFVIENLSVQPDHVHMFVSASAKMSPHTIVKYIKGGTSKILRSRYPNLMKLPALWSSSYYIGTVGFVSESVVKAYIDNQKGK